MTSFPNVVDQRILNPGRIGLVNEVAEGLSATVDHSASGGLIHSKFKITSDTTIISGAAAASSKAGGVKLFDFPLGKLVPVAARISGRLRLSDEAMTTTAGEIGLGTSVASGAASTIGGTPAFEDILQGGVPALSNITAGAVIEAQTYDDNRPHVPAAGDGVNASLYLNAASAFASGTTTNMLILSGSEVDVWWIHMEP